MSSTAVAKPAGKAKAEAKSAKSAVAKQKALEKKNAALSGMNGQWPAEAWDCYSRTQGVATTLRLWRFRFARLPVCPQGVAV